MYSQSLESTSSHEGGKGLSPYTMDQTTTYYTLGIDIGSTTVKVALLDQDLHIIFSDYERHYANIQETLAGLLKKALNQTGPIDIIPVITGSGGLTLSSHLHIPFVQEVVAVASALQDYAPQTDVAIELGGEDAKIIYFTGGIDQRMNGICAGGTGSFIDQMASLLQTDAAGLNTYAKDYKAIYPIAARCGVFAKSDIQPLINDGATREDLAASIFQAVVNQTISGLACGKPIRGNVAFLGGPLHFLSELKEAFIRTLNHDDAPADEPHARRLEPCKQGVDPERQVEDTAQCEKSAPQTSSGDVVARQKRAQQKRPRAESPVVKADLLVRKTQAPGCGIRFEEQRNDLHHEALAQPVQDDEGDIVPDMPFGEERRDNLFQARKAIPQRAAF